MPNKLEDYRVMDSCAFNHATHSSWLLLLFVNETKDLLNYPNVKTLKTKHASRASNSRGNGCSDIGQAEQLLNHHGIYRVVVAGLARIVISFLKGSLLISCFFSIILYPTNSEKGELLSSPISTRVMMSVTNRSWHARHHFYSISICVR